MMTASHNPVLPVRSRPLDASAQGQHSAGQLAKAAEEYREILALRPDVAEAHNNLGSILCAQGDFAQARARFEQAIALKPDYAEAYHNLGSLLRAQGQLDQAVAHYEQALALRP